MSLFFVDNSCDLSSHQIKNLGIECFDLPCLLNGKDCSTLHELEYTKFYSKLRKGMELKAKNMTEKSYMSVFEPGLKMGDDIIYVCSSEFIYDYKKLLSARDKLLETYKDRRFEIIDSKNFSAGHGIICFLLALKYRNGATIDELIEYYYQIKDSVALYMVVDSFDSVPTRSIANASTLVGSALNIKSIVAINVDGKFKVIDKVSGRKRAMMKLVQIVRQIGKNIADNPILIASSCGNDDVDYLENQLKEHFGQDLDVMKSTISPINTTTIGSGVIAIAFNVHKKIN